jgi:phenylalanyl-tRNA synthetase alpha subunit
LFNELAGQIKNLKRSEDKKEFGQILNQLKKDLETALADSQKQQELVHERLDLSLPGIKSNSGHLHPVSQAIEEISQIFERIGFVRGDYPEVDWIITFLLLSICPLIIQREMSGKLFLSINPLILNWAKSCLPLTPPMVR